MKRIVLMTPQRIEPARKRSALESDALVQLLGGGADDPVDLVDLHDIRAPESWSRWWQDLLTIPEVTLVLIPDGGPPGSSGPTRSVLGFRQQQRAERAARMGVPAYVLWQPDGATWQLTPIRDVDIRPMKPRPGHRLSLAQFAYITERG